MQPLHETSMPNGWPSPLRFSTTVFQLLVIVTVAMPPSEPVSGANVTVTVDKGGVVLTDGQGNKAKVVKTDIVASNGVIHVIDAVLLPPHKA